MDAVLNRVIADRIGMNGNSFRKAGYSITGSMTLDAALEFLQPRTIPIGRWSQEKADLTKQFLNELLSNKPAAVQPAAVQPVPVAASMPKIQEQEQEATNNWELVWAWLEDVLCIGIVMGHAILIAYDCAALWATPGLIGGGLAFMLQCLALLYSRNQDKVRTSGTALWVVAFVDVCAWFVHYPTFLASSADVSPIVTGSLCALLCFFSFIALYLYRDSKIS